MTSRSRDTLAVVFAMFFPLVMAWLYFVELAGDGETANPALQIAFSAGKLVQALFPALYVWWFAPTLIRFARPTVRGLALGVGFGLAVAFGMFVLYFGWLKHSELFASTPAQVLQKVEEFGAASPLGYLAMAGFICIIHSLFEEYYWRWFVFGWLKRLVPVSGAVIISGLGFTLHHIVILGVYFPGQFWTIALPFSLCVGVGGMIWAWIYHTSGSLYAAWISHAIIDAAILFVGYDMIAGRL